MKSGIFLFFGLLYLSILNGQQNRFPAFFEVDTFESNSMFFTDKHTIWDKHIFCKKNDLFFNRLKNIELLEMEFNILYQGSLLEFNVHKVNIFSTAFQVKDEFGNSFNLSGDFYRGTLMNDDKSIVTLSIVDGTVSLWVVGEKVQFEISKIGNDYFLNQLGVALDKEISCLTEEDDMVNLVRGFNSQRNQANCLDIYIEVDYDMYVANNNDVNELFNWTSSVFNNVAALYESEGVPIYMSGIFFHTSPDNYTLNL